MTSHILYPAWDAENPATQSPFVIEEIIRKRIGFAGLLLSDDLDMEALSGSVPERAERAIAAGCDIALNCWGRMDDMVGIAERLPAMSGAANERLEAALQSAQAVQPAADRAELIAKRDSLLGLARNLA
jgi:beta-N-acetylhexosaminidase